MTPARAVLLVLLAALAFRVALAFTHAGYLGVDGGAYLVGRNWVLGTQEVQVLFARAPLGPGWLLVPFTSWLGDDLGYKLWSALAATAPVVAVWLLARRLVPAPYAIAATAFAAVDLLLIEMLVTGALPLLGFSLIALGIVAVDGLWRRWSVSHAALLVIAVGLIPYVNQTAAGMAVVVLPAYVGARLAFRMAGKRRAMGDGTTEGETSPIFRILWPALLTAAVGAGALPWYGDVAVGSAMTRYPGPLFKLVQPWDSAWAQLAVALPLAALAIAKSGDDRCRALGVLLASLAVAGCFVSFDETIINLFYRSRYLQALPFHVLLGWAAWRYMPTIATKRIRLAGAAALVVLGTMGSMFIFQRQSSYSDMVTPATARAIERMTEPGAVVAPNFGMGTWISGLTGRGSWWAFNNQPPSAYAVTDQAVRCLFGWVPLCDPAAAQAALGAAYVLIDERFPYYNKRALPIYGAPLVDPWRPTKAAGWLRLIYNEGATSLWTIQVSGPSRLSSPSF